MPDPIRVTVVYALPERQALVQLELPAGATVGQAMAASGLAARFPELAAASLTLGVFGRVVVAAQPLRDGDRVEVYRPLRADPKAVRRELAAQGRTMGRRRD